MLFNNQPANVWFKFFLKPVKFVLIINVFLLFLKIFSAKNLVFE